MNSLKQIIFLSCLSACFTSLNADPPAGETTVGMPMGTTITTPPRVGTERLDEDQILDVMKATPAARAAAKKEGEEYLILIQSEPLPPNGPSQPLNTHTENGPKAKMLINLDVDEDGEYLAPGFSMIGEGQCEIGSLQDVARAKLNADLAARKLEQQKAELAKLDKATGVVTMDGMQLTVQQAKILKANMVNTAQNNLAKANANLSAARGQCKSSIKRTKLGFKPQACKPGKLRGAGKIALLAAPAVVQWLESRAYAQCNPSSEFDGLTCEELSAVKRFSSSWSEAQKKAYDRKVKSALCCETDEVRLQQAVTCTPVANQSPYQLEVSVGGTKIDTELISWARAMSSATDDLNPGPGRGVGEAFEIWTQGEDYFNDPFKAHIYTEEDVEQAEELQLTCELTCGNVKYEQKDKPSCGTGDNGRCHPNNPTCQAFFEDGDITKVTVPLTYQFKGPNGEPLTETYRKREQYCLSALKSQIEACEKRNLDFSMPAVACHKLELKPTAAPGVPVVVGPVNPMSTETNTPVAGTPAIDPASAAAVGGVSRP